MTTIILGAQGKLGGVLHRHAKRAGVSWLFQSRKQGSEIRWSGDMDDAGTALVFRPKTTIVNMIGTAQGDAAHLHATNVDFVRALLQRAADTGVHHVMLASSASVYGAGQGGPLTEDAILDPLSDYARSKVAMEQVAKEIGAQHPNLNITVLRIGNVAGSDAMLHHARRHAGQNTAMPLHHFANGQPAVRSYIGPSDLFDTIRTLTKPDTKAVRTLNIAAQTPVRLDALLAGYRKHLVPDLHWRNEPAPDGIPPEVILSTARLALHVDLTSMAQSADAMAQQVAQDCPP